MEVNSALQTPVRNDKPCAFMVLGVAILVASAIATIFSYHDLRLHSLIIGGAGAGAALICFMLCLACASSRPNAHQN